jgi:hypothetical protein|nr:MAG TPA: hypothetical protein [Caudoviricetes sp.]
MKYKLLKDTPTIKAGTIFEKVVRGVDGIKGSAVVVPIGANTDFQWTIKDIDNFDEWFEEITDSIYWKPKWGDKYYHINYTGYVSLTTWEDDSADANRLDLGFVYPTEEACRKARERRLAKVRLQRSSTFKPDFENGNGGWLVFYNYKHRKLDTVPDFSINSGEPVRYKTIEDAKRSIEENREDWMIYFGVKERED